MCIFSLIHFFFSFPFSPSFLLTLIHIFRPPSEVLRVSYWYFSSFISEAVDFVKSFEFKVGLFNLIQWKELKLGERGNTRGGVGEGLKAGREEDLENTERKER